MWKLATVAYLLLAAAGISRADVNPCAPTGQTPYDYKQALCMSILFYEAQRSGELPDDMRITWRGDSALQDGSDNQVDLEGGYYDAGDHVKFGFPMAYALTILSWGLISFREGYEITGQVEYAEAAIKWGTDYFLKAHTDSSTFWSQVGNGDIDHGFWDCPEDMTMSRPSYKITSSTGGTDLAGETAAALAAASIVFQDSDPTYSSECLEAAKSLFHLADSNRQKYTNTNSDANKFYPSYGFEDELVYSAAWLYKATNDPTYESKAKSLWNEFLMYYTAERFDWDNKYAGAATLFSELFGDSTYTSALKAFMDGIRSEQRTPGGMVYIDMWGSLRHALNVAFIAFKAADLGIDESANREFAVQQVNYALGSVGHSYMVGFGVKPPEKPHHRGSSCPPYGEYCDDSAAQYNPDANPKVLFGGIVGGPDSNDYYVDDRMDAQHNEVACDYNAAATGALAAMVKASAAADRK